MLIFLACRIANPTERASSSFCGHQHCSSDEMTQSPCRDAPWRVRHRLCLRRGHGRFRGASLRAKGVMPHFVWAWRREAKCCRREWGRLLRRGYKKSRSILHGRSGYIIAIKIIRLELLQRRERHSLLLLLRVPRLLLRERLAPWLPSSKSDACALPSLLSLPCSRRSRQAR